MTEPQKSPSVPAWCDGTPHSPKAIPPLPLHDLRWDGDDPYTKCVRCGLVRDYLGNVVVAGRVTDSEHSSAVPGE